jgi:hypothetical protein
MARDADIASIYQLGSSPATRVAISMKNRIFSTPYSTKGASQKQVGVLSTFDQSEGRAVDPVRAVGFGDRVVELVPGLTEPLSITMNRSLMYTSGIVQELGYRGGVDGLVRSLRHHKWPFDLRSELVFSEIVNGFDFNGGQIPTESVGKGIQNVGSAQFALITYFWTCWLSNYSVSFPADSAIVMEDATVMVTDVTDGASNYGTSADAYGDLLDAGNNPLINSGSGSKIFSPR